MRYLLLFLLIFPLIADEMAFSVDEGFVDPYAPPCYECEDDCYDDDECCDEDCTDCDLYDADVDDAWYWRQKYPGRNTDEFMEELTQPWQ